MRIRAIEHLEELRYRILAAGFFFLLFFALGIMLSPFIIKRIMSDMMLSNIILVSLSPLEFIYTQIKVGFIFSLALTFPIMLYQLIRFIKPGLKVREAVAIKYILPSFLLLFIAGILFSYCIFLKTSLYFLANLSSLVDIQNLWSINQFISFIITISLALGFVFELPLVLILLHRLCIINIKLLNKYRPHIYVLAFILAAIITPPDAVTQIMVALPLIVLFEASYWLIRIF